VQSMDPMRDEERRAMSRLHSVTSDRNMARDMSRELEGEIGPKFEPITVRHTHALDGMFPALAL
jgi:hypothetical protein